MNHYTAFAVPKDKGKQFEFVAISNAVSTNHKFDSYQFGFKKGHSTGLCTSAVKQTIEYYTSHGSHFFACFVDFTKAFDRVNYWKLFNQLLSDGVDLIFVRLLVFWYTEQQGYVRWRNVISDFFLIGNGTKQGGVLSPYLFTRYVRDIIANIVQSCTGCAIGNVFTNIFAYADDMILLAPSWAAMQQLLDLLHFYCEELDIVCNSKKTVCMMFKPRCKDKIVADEFPPFSKSETDVCRQI